MSFRPEDDVPWDDRPKKSRRPRKWIAGDPVGGLDALLKAIDNGRRLWLHRKSYHPLFMSNMSLGTMRYQANRGVVRYAEINPEYVNWLRAELAAVTEEAN